MKGTIIFILLLAGNLMAKGPFNLNLKEIQSKVLTTPQTSDYRNNNEGSCNDYSGNWYGSCVSEEGLEESEMTIVQDGCLSIKIDDKTYTSGKKSSQEHQSFSSFDSIESIKWDGDIFKLFGLVYLDSQFLKEPFHIDYSGKLEKVGDELHSSFDLRMNYGGGTEVRKINCKYLKQ